MAFGLNFVSLVVLSTRKIEINLQDIACIEYILSSFFDPKMRIPFTVRWPKRMKRGFSDALVHRNNNLEPGMLNPMIKMTKLIDYSCSGGEHHVTCFYSKREDTKVFKSVSNVI